MRSPKGLALLVAVAARLLAPWPAAAQEPPDEEIARRHFERASEAYQRRDYPTAIREFEAARAVRPLPELDYDIGRCLDRMERPREAIEAYERFVARATPNDDTAAARTRVAELRARLPRRGPPAGAVIGVGVVGLASLAVGAGLLGATAAAYADLERSCAPTCDRDRWADLPLRRDLGVAFLAIGGAAAVTDAVLLGVRLRRRR